MMLHSNLFLLASALGANAQTLYDAISKIPELSSFTAFYASNQVLASTYFSNQSLYPITFLAPNNDAFNALLKQFGGDAASIPIATLLDVVQYHTLVSNVTTTDFDNGGKQGLTVPTMLQNVQYNNRSAGEALASKFGGAGRANGQVVFITGGSTAGKFRVMARQNGGQPANSIRSGLSSNVGIKALDGKEGVWDGGRFHIVDGILTPPTLCATTIRNAGLSSLDNALNRTMLWNALDSSKNVTCLGPNNAAFGGADNTLNTTVLTDAILYHTLPEVAYSDYLYDGQEFKTLQNGTVRVKVTGQGKDRTIYFNNAKVVDANVLTHNGLVHVLDAVMMPLEQLNATSSAKPSGSPSATGTTPSVSAVSSSAATSSVVETWNWSFLALLSSVFLMA